MKVETIEQRIADKANKNVQAKIAKFKESIESALRDLFGTENCASFKFGEYIYSERNGNENSAYLSGAHNKLAALRLAVQDKEYSTGSDRRETKLPWPKWLWDREVEAIRDELMSKMDLMQQLLMTKKQPSENDEIHE